MDRSLTVFTFTSMATSAEGRFTRQFLRWTRDSSACVVWPLFLREVGATIMEDRIYVLQLQQPYKSQEIVRRSTSVNIQKCIVCKLDIRLGNRTWDLAEVSKYSLAHDC